MKLSALMPHTSEWLGIPLSQVKTVARVLQPAGLLTLGGRGPGGAEMTADDKINLLLGVCGVEVANRAADHVRIWNRLIRFSNPKDQRFAFQRATSVKEFIVDLITKDLNGGPLDQWLKEADDKYDRQQNASDVLKHKITLDFYVDEFSFTLVVSRFVSAMFADVRESSGNVIEIRFGQPVPGGEHEFVYGEREKGYKAGSRLIRRLDAKNLIGWGTCLND